MVIHLQYSQIKYIHSVNLILRQQLQLNLNILNKNNIYE